MHPLSLESKVHTTDRLEERSAKLNLLGAGYAAAYSASKFAVRGLTQSAGVLLSINSRLASYSQQSAQELGKYGITVNAYAPGLLALSMPGRALELI